MNANEMTFGVEIETLVSQRAQAFAAGLNIGHYHRGNQVPYLPQGWKAERDGSLSGRSDEISCEIVSPVLKGADGLAQVITVLKKLEEMGHRVNVTCGIHVHVGWGGDAVSLARLITIVAYAEQGLYAVTGTKNRERGRYCKKVRCYGNAAQAKHTIERDRYHGLNLNPLASGRGTVEFRFFSGSLNPTKVVGWIQICLGLVQRAITSKRSPKWTPAPLKGGWKKAGDGQSECERLMGYLAWGQGYTDAHGSKTYGLITDATSVIAMSEHGITLKAVQTEMRRLAKKYDTAA